MATYQKKYISLRDAAIISGYTVAELKKFCAIGLIPFRKQKSRYFVRFDAFEKIQEDRQKKAAGASAKPVSPVQQTTMKKSVQSVTSLVPFTTPDRHLVKLLEPVAFTAALIMVLHISMLPGVAERVVFGLDLSQHTVAYMGGSAESLVRVSVSMPASAALAIADIRTSSALAASVGINNAGQVAGISNISGALAQAAGNDDDPFTTFFVGIADASDSFQRFVVHWESKANTALFSLQFSNIDPFIQSAFRW